MKFMLVLSALCLNLAQATTVLTVLQKLNYELNATFPSNVFNSSCVGKSCPGLSSPSVCGPDSSVDNKATILALSKCMKDPICGLNLDSRQYVFVTFAMNQVVPTWAHMYIQCNTTKDGFYKHTTPVITSTSQNDFDFEFPKLELEGYIMCNLYNTTHSPPKTLDLNKPQYFKFDFYLNFVLTVGNKLLTSISKPNYKVNSVNFGNFTLDDGAQTANLTSTYGKNVKVVLGEDSLFSYVSNFYKNIVDSALQAASNTCRSHRNRQ